MTKCHFFLLAVLVLLSASCKNDRQGGSLSEFGARTEASQEVRFEQYVRDLWNLPVEEALRRQDSLLRTAEQDSAEWARITNLEDKYFLDPNSPFRNEELFIPVAEHLLTAPYSSDRQRQHAQWALPRLKLNRLGQKAADLEFLTPKGRRTSLYATMAERKPQKTLLFFSNPGCPNCLEIMKGLNEDEDIQDLIESGKLLVVNIYPDQDISAWLDYLPHYPDTWVCGHDGDQVLFTDTVYWLRAIPSLYLLDSEGRVLLKDATLENILVNCKQR